MTREECGRVKILIRDGLHCLLRLFVRIFKLNAVQRLRTVPQSVEVLQYDL